MTPTYSIVIPIKNEEESLLPLIEEIERVMKRVDDPWELIIIDDGSTDQSCQLVRDMQAKKDYLRLISFHRNYGQSAAFACGFDQARGDFVITLDGDGQNDPQDILKLIAAKNEADLIAGWRKERRDPLQKRLISSFSNAIRSRLCEDGIHDTGCSLKLYRREALQTIPRFRGMHRFLPALFLIEGFRVKEIPVSHREREKGKTKYHFFNRLIGPITDLLFVLLMKKKHLTYSMKDKP